MPVYEYRCNGCQKIFEYQQRMVEPAKTTCEECAGALERLISRSSFSFKGGGWYKDLYASPSKSSNDAGGDKTTSSETKSETKPESAPAAASSSSDSGGGSAASTAAGPAT
jgi:putative FmdB family regulatory protein